MPSVEGVPAGAAGATPPAAHLQSQAHEPLEGVHAVLAAHDEAEDGAPHVRVHAQLGGEAEELGLGQTATARDILQRGCRRQARAAR